MMVHVKHESASSHNNNNNNSMKSRTADGVLQMMSNMNRTAAESSHHKSTESLLYAADPKNSSDLITEYIVDPFTRTTYVKGRFLGKGGFARVHEIRDLTTNKEYACKIIPKSRLTKPHQKEKILREVQLHRTLKHKNVVQFHHFFEDQENVYIILEFCSQKSLIHVLRNRKILTECEVRYYMQQLAQGVQYIHSQGVIHRDLKLGNMFLSEDMEVKIGDFGLATRITADGLKKGNICGTPNYIAPEVLNMEGHGFAADIWAMGCIMYALLVGQPPFETSTLNETYARITSNSYMIPSTVSEEARDLITSMLDPDPSKRPSAGQVLQHEFFTNGYMPNVLSVACCKTVPKFPPMLSIPRSMSAAEHVLSEEIKKMTMSTLRIHAPPKTEPKGSETVITKSKSTSAKESESSKKESCFHKALRKKLTRVLCPDKYRKPKTCTMASLYQRLSMCIDSIPEVTDEGDKHQDSSSLVTPLFVAKWIDYSNKYGFGFQLSDRSVGVLFNDATKMSLSPDRSRMEFHDSSGKLNVYSASNVPPHLQERFVLVKYFSQYMDENLTDGGDLHPDSKKKGPIPFMRRWVRTSHTIIMQLSNSTLQINFFKDHTKIIVADGDQDGLVTYINEDRHSKTYSFESLIRFGCKTCVYTRLQYALSVLDEFAGLEGEEV